MPAICDDGWQSIDGACFIFDATKKKLSRFNAQQECKKLDANLPSITSRDVSEHLRSKYGQSSSRALSPVRETRECVKRDCGPYCARLCCQIRSPISAKRANLLRNIPHDDVCKCTILARTSMREGGSRNIQLGRWDTVRIQQFAASLSVVFCKLFP